MNRDRLIDFAQALVQRPSLSCQEEKVAERVEEEMKGLGFDVVTLDDFGSVIGVVGGAEPGPTLLFDAHTDTVDVTGGVPWEKDPFSGEVADGFLHGRGSVDMKGALAAMVQAAGGVDRTRIRGRIVVSASSMEEVLEGVALQAVMADFPPDFVVIGEATDLNLARGGRGRAEIHLETMGRTAVLDMLKVIGGVEGIGGVGGVELPVDPLMGPAILALTEISSAPYPANSVIPSICRATYDRRRLPGETEEAVLEPIKSLAEAEDITLKATTGVGEYTAFTGHTLRKEKFFPAWVFPEDDWLVTRAVQGLAISGLTPEVGAYRFCTNAAYSAGVAGVPTVGFGPAKESDAHMVDERLRLVDLEAATRGYEGIIEAVLGTDD